jgi:hypothetical protein
MSAPEAALSTQLDRRRASDSTPAPRVRGGAPGGPYGGILNLQRSAGNSVGDRLLGGGAQPEPPDDPRERAADAVAHDLESDVLESSSTLPPGEPAADARTGGQPLPWALRRTFEARLGVDLARVRVHTDAPAALLNTQLNTRAITHEQDIFLGSGEFAPDAPAGRQLLAHEVTHTVQQRASGGAAIQAQPKPGAPPPDSKIVRATVYTALNVVELSLADGTTETLATDYNGEPNPGTYTARRKGARGSFELDVPNKAGGVPDVNGNLVLWTSQRGTAAGVTSFTMVVIGGIPSGSGTGKGPSNPAPAGPGGQTDGVGTADKKPAGQPDAPPPPAPTGKTPADQPAPTPPGGTGTTPTEAPPPAAPPTPETLAKLKALPPDIKDLLGGETALTPDKADQLLRVAEKLKALAPEDRALYKLLAKQLATDLDSYERSIDLFIKFKERLRAQAQADAQKAADEQASSKAGEPPLEEQLAATWVDFDESKFAGMDESQKEQMARDVAAKQRDIQLSYMARHPGQTIGQMAEGMVRLDKTAKAIADDVREAADGNANGYARAAGALGAIGKFIGAVASIVFVALLFVPGVNLIELAAAGMAVGIAMLALSLSESEMRIKAASEAKSSTEFQTQTQKSAQAQVAAAMTAATIALTIVAKLVARIPLPGRLQTVGGALKAARTGLLRVTGVGPAMEAVRDALLNKLRQAKLGLSEALGQQTKLLAEQTAMIEKMTATELVDRLAAGDPTLNELTSITAEQAQGIREFAKTPAGKSMPDQLRQNLLKGMADAPGKAKAQVDRFLSDMDDAIEAAKKAQSPQQLNDAVAAAEQKLGPDAQAAQKTAQLEDAVKEQLQIDRFKNLSNDQVRALAMTDPLAADELVRRYSAMKIGELDKLAKTDPTAKYVLDKKRGTYAHEADYDLRSSNPKLINRLVERVRQLRAASKIPKVGPKGESGGVFGVAETDLPVAQDSVEAGSRATQGGGPAPADEPPRVYKPPSGHEKAQFHAEERLVNKLREQIEAAKLTSAQMKGKTVWIAIEQEVCPICKAGMAGPDAAAGTLKQFSLEFPDLTIEFTDIDSYSNTFRVWRLRGGKLVK